MRLILEPARDLRCRANRSCRRSIQSAPRPAGPIERVLPEQVDSVAKPKQQTSRRRLTLASSAISSVQTGSGSGAANQPFDARASRGGSLCAGSSRFNERWLTKSSRIPFLNNGRFVMVLFQRTASITSALLIGIAIGATAIPGLYAQGAKTKAYSISENEILDKSAQAAYLPAARKALEAAGGRSLRTFDGRVVQIEGAPAPKNVGIIEWGSLDDAVAF